MIFNPHALAAIREARGISKAGLAKVDGLSASYITQLEKGRRTNPSTETLVNLAEALQVDPRALYFAPSVDDLLNEMVAKVAAPQPALTVAIDLLTRVRDSRS